MSLVFWIIVTFTPTVKKSEKYRESRNSLANSDLKIRFLQREVHNLSSSSNHLRPVEFQKKSKDLLIDENLLFTE